MNTVALRTRASTLSQRLIVRSAPAVSKPARPVPVISAQDKALFATFGDAQRFSLSALRSNYQQQ